MKKKKGFTWIFFCMSLGIIVAGSLFKIASIVDYNISDIDIDLSKYEMTYGFVKYKERIIDDKTYYYPMAEYYVDGQKYEWKSKFFSVLKMSDYPENSMVDVYYKANNPSDSAVPNLVDMHEINSRDEYGSMFLGFGIIFLIIDGLIVGCKWLFIGLVLGGAKPQNDINYFSQNNQFTLLNSNQNNWNNQVLPNQYSNGWNPSNQINLGKNPWNNQINLNKK